MARDKYSLMRNIRLKKLLFCNLFILTSVIKIVLGGKSMKNSSVNEIRLEIKTHHQLSLKSRNNFILTIHKALVYSSFKDSNQQVCAFYFLTKLIYIS